MMPKQNVRIKKMIRRLRRRGEERRDLLFECFEFHQDHTNFTSLLISNLLSKKVNDFRR